jgi:hypothetical protein
LPFVVPGAVDDEEFSGVTEEFFNLLLRGVVEFKRVKRILS